MQFWSRREGHRGDMGSGLPRSCWLGGDVRAERGGSWKLPELTRSERTLRREEASACRAVFTVFTMARVMPGLPRVPQTGDLPHGRKYGVSV